MGASREYGQFRRRRSDYAGKSEGKAAMRRLRRGAQYRSGASLLPLE